MENETKVETVETQNTQETQEPEVNSTTVENETTQTDGEKSHVTKVLRELSKTFSVNLFDENGLTMLKEKLDNKDNEYNKAQEKLNETLKQAQLFEQKEQDYQIKIEALGLGFSANNLDEVLALAKVNAKDGDLKQGLKSVKEKYGSVFASSNIGTQHNDLNGEKPDIAKSEEDKYLRNSKYYQMWQKQQNKN